MVGPMLQSPLRSEKPSAKEPVMIAAQPAPNLKAAPLQPPKPIAPKPTGMEAEFSKIISWTDDGLKKVGTAGITGPVSD